MKIKKVEIDCSDKFKYTQIAFLVDRDDFRSDVFLFRQKWLKGYDPFTAKNGDKWYDDFLDKTMDDNLDKKTLNRLDYLKREVYNEYAKGATDEEAKQRAKLAYSNLENFERKDEYSDFKADIKNLMIKYHLPMVFITAIRCIVVAGEIDEEVWSNCRASLEPAYERDLDIGEVLKEPCCVFMVTPYTTFSDIGNLFRKSKDKIKKLYRDSEYEVMKYAEDTVPTIMTSRIWYWKHLSKEEGGEGKSYLKIAEEMKEKTKLYQRRDRVRKAIKAYCGNLSRPIRKLDITQKSVETS